MILYNNLIELGYLFNMAEFNTEAPYLLLDIFDIYLLRLDNLSQ